MRDSSLTSMPLTAYAAIAVAALTIAFAVIRRVNGGGGGRAARRSLRQRSPRPLMAFIAAVVASVVGLTTLLADRRGASVAAVGGDPLKMPAEMAPQGIRVSVLIAIGLLAVVALAVTLLKLRDGER